MSSQGSLVHDFGMLFVFFWFEDAVVESLLIILQVH